MDRAGDSFRLRNVGLALAVSLTTLLLAGNARADQFVLDLTSPQYFDHAASTGIWDTQFPTTGRIWAPYSVAGAATKLLDFGNGSDGDFVDGPAQTGITVSGPTITINTNQKSNFQFSSFTLNAGKTIQVTGSQPLVIRVFGRTAIYGTLSANGGNGSTNGSGTTLVTGTIAGGVGVAGGGTGGNGSPTTAPLAASGASGLPAPAGASGGIDSNSSGLDYGGGGGCNGNATATASPMGTAGGTCGTGTSIASAFETTFAGGGGGGGGGNYLVGSVVGGAGGGAGGGAIRIVSLGSVTLNGVLSANGGAGGANNASLNANVDCGGGGGGGAGGSLWLQTPYSISGTGSVSVAQGLGGVTATCTGGVGVYDGGSGTAGVYRADIQTTPYAGPGTATASNAVTPPSTAQSYTIVSKPIPLLGFYTFQPPTETQGCGAQGTLSVVYEGSNDGTNFQNAVPAAQISQLSNFPFIRFRVTIAATGASPPCLIGLSIPYAPSPLSDLTLKGGLACGTTRSGRGGRSGDDSSGTPWALCGDLLLLMSAFFLGRKRRSVHP